MTTEPMLSPRSIAARQEREEQGCTCTAHIEFSEAEIAFLDRSSRALFTKMPFSGPGFECYDYRDHHYGRSSTIQAIIYICGQWAKQHPNEPRIGVGDISLPDGGDTQSHQTHEEGVDADFSVVTNNGKEEPSNWRQENYSRSLTQAFVDLVWNNPVLKPTLVYFNDPDIKGVEYCAGHDDHLHVRFGFGDNVPAVGDSVVADEADAVEDSSDEGELALKSPHMQGDRVKALQTGLLKAGIHLDADAVFGKDTETALKQFQSQHGLEANGVANESTLLKLVEQLS